MTKAAIIFVVVIMSAISGYGQTNPVAAKQVRSHLVTQLPITQDAHILIAPNLYSIHVGDGIHYTVQRLCLHGQPLCIPGIEYRGINPTSPGPQAIGPITITNNGEVLTAPRIAVTVLPVNTNAYFEIRVQEFDGPTNRCVEIVIETQSLTTVVMPYATSSRLDTNLCFFSPNAPTNDWIINGNRGTAWVRQNCIQGETAVIPQRRYETYRFIPLRTGQLTITSAYFTNLPPDHVFEPITVFIPPN